MKATRRKHVSWITAGLLILLVAVYWRLEIRNIRQQRLSNALFAAVENRDTSTVVSLLKQGVDPNPPTEAWDPRPFWQILYDGLLGINRSPPHGP